MEAEEAIPQSISIECPNKKIKNLAPNLEGSLRRLHHLHFILLRLHLLYYSIRRQHILLYYILIAYALS